MTDLKALSQKGIGELEKAIQRFETYNDGFILPDTQIVLRLDAHRLGAWDLGQEEYPCGPRATAAFQRTAIALMTATYRVTMAYHHGDEISVLLDPTENNNPLRRSKLISAFASTASVNLLQSSGFAAMFDTRLSELPSTERVLEYFLWQRRYCYRNAITIALRKALLAQGYSPEAAEKQIHGVSEHERLKRLEDLGAPITNVPASTRRGTLVYWEAFTHEGREHFRIRANNKLPEDDTEFLQMIIRASGLESINPSAPSSTPVTAEKRKVQPARENPKQQSQPAPPPPPAKQQPKKNRVRPNVSVFKVAGNS
jgi:tRNA(His) 5'-end guanylyltransferase